MSEPTTIQVRLAAPVDTVRRALTDADALRIWLAEYADVDLPNRFAFWGRYTPGGEARQELLRADENGLRFSWLLDGVPTIVEIELGEENQGSTILALSQTGLPDFGEMVAGNSTLSLMYTYWALALANLADFVAGRELIGRCDFTSPVMREQLLIAAPPEDVYESITDPEIFAEWFGACVESEGHVGGRWAMGGLELDPAPARIVDLEPGRALSLAYDDGLVATWELADSGGQTRLTFVQSGFDESRPPYGAWMGWLAGLAELRRYHEVAGWRPMWLAVHVEGTPDGIITLPKED